MPAAITARPSACVSQAAEFVSDCLEYGGAQKRKPFQHHTGCLGIAALLGIPISMDCHSRLEHRVLDVQCRIWLADDESEYRPVRRIARPGRKQSASVPARITCRRSCGHFGQTPPDPGA